MLRSLSGLMFDVSYEGKVLKVYKTGRLVFEGARGREEVEEVLRKILD